MYYLKNIYSLLLTGVILFRKGLSVEQLKQQVKQSQEENSRWRREEQEAALAAQKQKQGISSDKPTSRSRHDMSRKDSSPVKVCHVLIGSQADVMTFSAAL
jgi:cell division protein FtsB